MTRVQIVDNVFSAINQRTDEGVGIFRSMVKSLLEWSHFDPIYFEKLGKLNRLKAEEQLQHLRQLQEIRDAKLQAERDRRISVAEHAAAPSVSIEDLRREFLSLHSGCTPPQQRGYALERILRDMAKLSQLEVTEPFRIRGEQIDGAVKYDGEHYLIEAKWQEKSASNEPVYQFAGKIEGKMYGRGLFVSVQGFSDNIIEGLVRGKAIRTIFADGADLVFVLESQITFAEMLDRKIKAAQTRGEIYVHPIDGRPKLIS